VRKIVIALVGIGLVLAGCGSSTAKSAKETPAQRLSAAKRSFDASRYIGFDLSTSQLPSGVSTGLYSASGTGTHAPAFTGKVKAKAGLTLDVDVVAVGGKVYAKLPFVGWTSIDVTKYGAPDPAALMNRSTGLSSLFIDATHLKAAGQERAGSTVLSKVTGTVPGVAVHAIFPTAATKPFDATFKLTDANDLRSAEFTGPFYGGQDDVTYTLNVRLDASQVDIKAP
jgi:lipoprotein LprG